MFSTVRISPQNIFLTHVVFPVAENLIFVHSFKCEKEGFLVEKCGQKLISYPDPTCVSSTCLTVRGLGTRLDKSAPKAVVFTFLGSERLRSLFNARHPEVECYFKFPGAY